MSFDRKQFKKAMKEILSMIFMALGVVLFCVFIYRHSGLNVKMRNEVIAEYTSYEYVVRTSPNDYRIKEIVPQKVVYRVIEK